MCGEQLAHGDNFMFSAIVSAWCTLPGGLLHCNLVRM